MINNDNNNDNNNSLNPHDEQGMCRDIMGKEKVDDMLWRTSD